MIYAQFRVEGRARQYYPDGGHAILFGMLKEECNWCFCQSGLSAGNRETMLWGWVPSPSDIKLQAHRFARILGIVSYPIGMTEDSRLAGRRMQSARLLAAPQEEGPLAAADVAAAELEPCSFVIQP